MAHSVIKGRTEIVGYVTYDDAEPSRRLLKHLTAGGHEDDGKPGLWVVLGDKAVGVVLNEPSDFGLQFAEMLPCPPHLQSCAIKRVRHA